MQAEPHRKGVDPDYWLLSDVRRENRFYGNSGPGSILKPVREAFVGPVWELCWDSGRQGEDLGSEKKTKTTKAGMKTLVLLLLTFTSAMAISEYPWK